MLETIPQTKMCFKCNTEKDRSFFNKYHRNKDGLQSHCKDCQRDAYLKNKDAILIQRSERYYKDIESSKASNRERYKNNREVVLAQQKEYYKKNSTRIRLKSKQYYEANKESINERNKPRQKLYESTEKGKAVRFSINSKRRSVIKNNKIPSSKILELKQKAKKCYWCGESLKNKEVHLDHYIPIKRGGENKIENIVVSCSKCNKSKSAKDPIEFANKIGKLF